ncbi:MAG: hypothetical protein ACHQEM_02545 [Chitinophagales bacterium]
MNLMIYETTHHETLPAILDLAESYFSNTTVYLKESSYQNLCSESLPESRWLKACFVRQKPSESNRNFITTCFQEANKGDFTHFHISTLDNNLLYFSLQLMFARKIKISLSVQAVNEYAALRSATFRDFTESIAKIYLHRRIRRYRVFSPKMADHLKQRIPHSMPVYIPPRFYGQPAHKTIRDFLKIVVPGSFDPIRRDYVQVVAFFKEFLDGGPYEKRIELVMLGNSSNEYGKKIISDLKKAESNIFSVKYYSDYIMPAEYEFQLRDADLVWSPIQIQTKGIRNTPEIYGQSTATGLTGDLLLGTTPALLPIGFSVPEHYENAIILYQSTADLTGWIQYFMRTRDDQRQSKIEKDFSFFCRRNFQAPFEMLFELNRP